VLLVAQLAHASRPPRHFEARFYTKSAFAPKIVISNDTGPCSAWVKLLTTNTKETLMSDVGIVRQWYQALGAGDMDALFNAFAPDIEWREAEGHPYSPADEAWRGGEAIRDNLFSKLAGQWDNFHVIAHSFHDASPVVVVEGRYIGTFRASGRRLNAQFCHVWQVRDGRLARFQQYTDTGQLQVVASVPVLRELMSGLS
jgi:ketosteroid isomerase-like protein